MLMYHSNAQVICIVWIFDLNFLSIFVDLALFRLIQTEQNTHQSGFTCSIFAKQSVDFTFFQLKCDIIICDDSGKTLGYSQHFNCIFTHLRFLLFSWQSRRQKAQVIKRLLITSFTKNLSSEQYYKSYYDGTYVKKGSGHCSLPFFSLHGHSSC